MNIGLTITRKENRMKLEPKAEERAKVEVASVKNTNSGLSPEEIYYSALGIALAQDFTLANKAFADFPDNTSKTQQKRGRPFLAWQMEFMDSKFDYAAMTLSEFNSQFPDDENFQNRQLWLPKLSVILPE